MAGRLADKSAIITGGGSGIGFAIAQLFGREGARVSILERDVSLADNAETELREHAIDAAAFCVDVTDARGVAAAYQKIIGRYAGVVHVLVNNAGIAEFDSVEDTTLDA